MEITIKINTDNAAFDAVHFSDTIKGLLDFSAEELSNVVLNRTFTGMRSALIDPNGNKCGYVQMLREFEEVLDPPSKHPSWYDVADAHDGQDDLGE